jgi:hypothetical protein
VLVVGSEIGVKPVVVGTRGLVAGDGAPMSTEKIITGLTATHANGAGLRYLWTRLPLPGRVV